MMYATLWVGVHHTTLRQCRHERSHVVWVYLFRMSTGGKETKSKLMVAMGWGDSTGVPFWG